jgi:NhaA family Na+:H+ antiporter
MAGSTTSVSQDAPGRDKYMQALWIERMLQKETIGGGLILFAAVLAVVLSNTFLSDEYFALRETYLTLAVGEWSWGISVGKLTADGLLAIFFFLIGLELKREFIVGELRHVKTAIVPITAAIGGVIVPAGIYLAFTSDVEGASRGWAIPIATDIAFALAVLAVVGTSLPLALRTFLLTLAVVDDLIGITVIAVFYTEDLNWTPMIGVVIGLMVYGFIAQRYARLFRLRPGSAWVILFPIGLVVWFFMFESGVHATIAGVLLGMLVPVKPSKYDPGMGGDGEFTGLAEVFEHRFRPMSAGIAVPLFAFFAAGVNVGTFGEFIDLLGDSVTLGIITALIVGKTIGVTLFSFLVTRLPGVSLPRGVAWVDMFGIALLAGIGFTVSLLIGELSFGTETLLGDEAKIGILVGSVGAALLASLLLTRRNRYYQEQVDVEHRDLDGDGIPDIYQRDETQS